VRYQRNIFFQSITNLDHTECDQTVLNFSINSSASVHFTSYITYNERQRLPKLCEWLHISEDACVSEAIRRFLIYYAPMLKRQKQETLKLAEST
jgi:hypothetical protein